MNKYHFIGIGGIGMSALAKILIEKGNQVQGSDSYMNMNTEELKKLGVLIKDHSPLTVLDPSWTVVVSTAIAPDHIECQSALQSQSKLLHRSQLLAELIQGSKPLLVAGTHGKTTTSSLLAYVLSCAQKFPSFAVGGILLNFGTNGKHDKGEYFVAETDESDGSFLQYQAYGAIITNVGDDHLNYWKTKEALIEGFRCFTSKVHPYLWWCADDPHLDSFRLKGQSYGFSSEADLQIASWKQVGNKLEFSLFYQGQTYSHINLPLMGKHNVANGAAVFGLGLQLGIPESIIRLAFETFKGVKRRLEKRGEKQGIDFYDDYAHHPTEIKGTLKALKHAIQDRRLVVIFQPHRYTRVKDCWKDFLSAFTEADVLFITDIYSAGEKSLEGIQVEDLFHQIQDIYHFPVYFFHRLELGEKITPYLRPHDVVLTLGAGDIKDVIDDLLKKDFPLMRIALCKGGKSAEHEISLRSADTIYQALNPSYYIVDHFTISKQGRWIKDGQEEPLSQIVHQLLNADLAFPIFHGPFGEDGTIQGFFEILGIPYTGCDFRSCVVTMNKVWAKKLVSYHGIDIAKFLDFSILEWKHNREQILQALLQEFSFPFYIKPANLGSTIGIHRVKSIVDLIHAIDDVSTLDYHFLAEEEIKGQEIEFGLLGNEDFVISNPIKIVVGEELHSYQNKYGSQAPLPILKVDLDSKTTLEGQVIGRQVYRILGCKGFARIDFFLKSDGTWVFNEVNAIPGCTRTSGYPLIWEEQGIALSEVVDRIIIAGLARKRYVSQHLCPPKEPPLSG